MQRYAVYLYLETALHVSGGISTHHQEHTHTIVSTASGTCQTVTATPDAVDTFVCVLLMMGGDSTRNM